MVEHNFTQEPYRTCYEKHNSSDVNNQARMCIYQCYYDAIGMISGGEKILLGKYHAYRDSLEPPLREAFAHALKVCAKITAQVITHLAAKRQTFKCSPIAYVFNRCLSEVCLVNCPPDRWMNSSLCDELALKLKQKLGPGILL
uniref:Uncharacterized protein n=1 Tax=Anopheles dirus TaxID=7168 RepID=A0A182NME0_9DIPT